MKREAENLRELQERQKKLSNTELDQFRKTTMMEKESIEREYLQKEKSLKLENENLQTIKNKLDTEVAVLKQKISFGEEDRSQLKIRLENAIAQEKLAQ